MWREHVDTRYNNAYGNLQRLAISAGATSAVATADWASGSSQRPSAPDAIAT